MAKNKSKRIDVVYSTNPDFEYSSDDGCEEETKAPRAQHLTVSLDRKSRKGKTVTLVTNFIGNEADLKGLSKMLKSKCGVGGSCKDGQILIQGDFAVKVIEILQKEGYNVKRSGG